MNDKTLDAYSRTELEVLYAEFRRVAHLAKHLGVRKEKMASRLDELGIKRKGRGHPKRACPFSPERLKELFEQGGLTAVAREARCGWTAARRWCENLAPGK